MFWSEVSASVRRALPTRRKWASARRVWVPQVTRETCALGPCLLLPLRPDHQTAAPRTFRGVSVGSLQGPSWEAASAGAPDHAATSGLGRGGGLPRGGPWLRTQWRGAPLRTGHADPPRPACAQRRLPSGVLAEHAQPGGLLAELLNQVLPTLPVRHTSGHLLPS